MVGGNSDGDRHAQRDEQTAEQKQDAIIEHLDRLWAKESARENDRRQKSIAPFQISNYLVKHLIGSGSFGVVYLATHIVSGTQAAVKLPRLEVLQDPEKRRRFAQEAQLTLMLDHPGIVKVFEANFLTKTPYIISAWCNGPDLAQWLSEHHRQVQSVGASTWQDKLRFMAGIADALHHAHQSGVLHRDLKPANILMRRIDERDSSDEIVNSINQYQGVLTDFGLAKMCGPGNLETRSSLILGTPLYMAPEQLEGSAEDKSAATADIYSIGVILFELLTGELPVKGDSYVEIFESVRLKTATPLRRIAPQLPKNLETICGKCLKKNPSARYLSSQDLADDLRKCANGEAIAGRRESILSHIAFWSTRPKRISDSGWFAIWSIVLLVIWMVTTVCVAPLLTPISSATLQESYLDMALLVLLRVPVYLTLAWMVVKEKQWAVWVSLIVTAARVVTVGMMIGTPIFFKSLYDESGWLPFIDHLAFLVCIVVQFILHCFAAVAVIHRNRK